MSYSSHTVEQVLLPSTVDLVVAWLKLRPAVAAIAGTRISSTLPVKDSDIIYPWLTVQRVVGITPIPQAAIDRARIQFNSWGGVKTNEAPNWAPAEALILAVEREIRTVHSAAVDGKGVIMSASPLEGIQQLQDPDTNDARFWMDAVFWTRKE